MQTKNDKTTASGRPLGRLARARNGRRGATMVEFSLFFLLFLMLSLGIMEFARALWTYTTLAHAARQGARYAMVHGESNPVTDLQIRNVVVANAVGLVDSDLSVTPVWSPNNKSGSVVEVQVRYPFRFVTAPIVLSKNDLQLGSTSRMVIW